MKLSFLTRTAAAGLLLCATAHADEAAIGYIKTITDDAFLIENGKTEKASLGSAVHIGTMVKTNANGTAGITLKDNTMLSIGSDTELTLEAYQFAPEQDKLQLGANLLKGTLQYISGVIAKLKPEAVNLKTPTGVIAVRGTRFLVKIED